jgi:hypothetical protein
MPISNRDSPLYPFFAFCLLFLSMYFQREPEMEFLLFTNSFPLYVMTLVRTWLLSDVKKEIHTCGRYDERYDER